ncbi:hypothetical protein F5Y07DRAFT_373936 [Xylaria sp. FL0933]|nr:hypothetical protein F5Y07DRAFT_373936 [Xylaria sp. FL0933]
MGGVASRDAATGLTDKKDFFLSVCLSLFLFLSERRVSWNVRPEVKKCKMEKCRPAESVCLDQTVSPSRQVSLTSVKLETKTQTSQTRKKRESDSTVPGRRWLEEAGPRTSPRAYDRRRLTRRRRKGGLRRGNMKATPCSGNLCRTRKECRRQMP